MIPLKAFWRASESSMGDDCFVTMVAIEALLIKLFLSLSAEEYV